MHVCTTFWQTTTRRGDKDTVPGFLLISEAKYDPRMPYNAHASGWIGTICRHVALRLTSISSRTMSGSSILPSLQRAHQEPRFVFWTVSGPPYILFPVSLTTYVGSVERIRTIVNQAKALCAVLLLEWTRQASSSNFTRRDSSETEYGVRPFKI